MIGIIARMQLALVLVLLVCSQTPAHDSWISRGGLRNAAGEWCCGEGDCFAIPTRGRGGPDLGPRLRPGAIAWLAWLEDFNPPPSLTGFPPKSFKNAVR